ncbi:MAG: helix-turn-helix transcriptional regulator [Clostridia bacterium]|nr:helix-turn-helix transcriptional regulator [Clostridia bacterium]
MCYSDNVAKRIKYLAKDKKIVLKNLFEECGMGKNTMANITNGSIPKIENLSKIADHLECSIDYLLGRTDTVQLVKLPDKLLDIIEAKKDKIDLFISERDILIPPHLSYKHYTIKEENYNKIIEIYEGACKSLSDDEREQFITLSEYKKLFKCNNKSADRLAGIYYELAVKNYDVFLAVYEVYAEGFFNELCNK